MMKNLCTPVESDDIRTIITTNLDRAAKLNFAQVQQESHLEGLYTTASLLNTLLCLIHQIFP